MPTEIYNFFELSSAFDLKPEQAIKHFQSKGLKTSFSWLDMIGEENDAAYTVAKMMDNDLLSYVQEQSRKVVDEGLTLADFKKDLIPKLQKAGWWGKKDVIDPLTGQVTKAQLGSASRLENIFRTTLQSAYAVGQWQSIEANKETAPFLMYDAVEDSRTRPEHQQWNGTVRPVDDPFWQTHYPPNGWNCRCGTIQMSRDELKLYGLKPSPKPKIKKRKWVNPRTGKPRTIAADLDPGWDHNPGMRRMEHLRQLKKEKTALLSVAQQQANQVSDKAIEKAQKAFMTELAASQALKKLGKAETEGAFDRQKKKTLERAAQHQLDTAISENTPYLANAIKQLGKQKGTATLSARELLKKAKSKATSIEQSVLVNQYKKVLVNGKQPSAKAKAAYDDLPEAAQQAVDQSVELKTGQYQAKEALKNIKENPKGQTLKHQILTKLEQAGDAEKLTPTQLLKKVEDQYIVEQKKKETAAKLSGYKKKVLDGKLPTPGQQAAFNTLDDEAKEKFLAKVDAAKKKSAVPFAASKSETPAWANLTKIGNQKGSNTGGTYQDTTTGKKYYIKEPASEDIARNEVLAAKLYEAAGVDVPNLHLLNDGGTVRIASEIIEDLQLDGTKLGSGKIQGVNDNFMVDAWLANWDVAGLGYDNLLIKGSKAIRIDVGGSLLYRAQGGLKGSAFGKEVLEIESLRDSGMNPQSAAVFASASQEDLIAGAKKVLSLNRKQINELVETFGSISKKGRKELVATLVARQKYIAKQFPEAVKKPEPKLPKNSPITRLEYEQVKNSRSNGYAIATDKGDIEDHNVLLYQKKNLTGKDVTAAYFKVRPDMMRKLEKKISNQLSNNVNLSSMHQKMIRAIKAIAHRADMGNGMEIHVFEYIDDALEEYNLALRSINDDIRSGIRSQVDMNDFLAKAEPFYLQLIKAKDRTRPGTIPTWDKSLGIYEPFNMKPTKLKKEKTSLEWSKKKTRYQLSSFDHGHQREGIRTHTLDTHHYETTIDGVLVRYWPKQPGTYYALQGRVEIEIPGTQQKDTVKVFDTIGKLGINSQRASPLDIEELYLDKVAYIHRLNRKLNNETNGISDQQERIDLKLKMLNKDLKADLKDSPHYNPAGEYQAFGQGRRVFYRPELMSDPEFKTFEKDYRIYHHNTSDMTMAELISAVMGSGGQMATTTDKIRRGIKPGGMSPEADLRSGGANYFFTRIIKKNHAYNDSGFVWKAKQAARMDAISYAKDCYGKTIGNHVTQHRKTTTSELKKIAHNDSNETNFKDSLSLFDDLDRIVAHSNRERQDILKAIRDSGYDQRPDGRSLEDIVKVRGED